MYDSVCITNRQLCENDFFEQIKKVSDLRPFAIILREKDVTTQVYEEMALETLKICNQRNVKCILHTFYDVAIKLNVDAIHMPLDKLRNMSSEDKKRFKIIGTSCHSLEDVKEAEMLGCSYIIAGHIFQTQCKHGLKGRGLEFLREVVNRSDIPVYAIGGINMCNKEKVLECGAAKVCMMSEFMKI